MAIMNYKEVPEKKPVQVPDAIESPKHQSTLIDTKYTPRYNILTQIEGSPWKVDYYSQVLNDDTALQGHSPGKDALNQSYILVKDFIFKVTSPLSTSQDPRTNTFLVVGTANVYPFLKPNQGDMFIADIGDGRSGLFRITTVEEKSIYKETTASIDYQLVSYADGVGGEKRFKDITDKVVETRHFVREFTDYNQNPYVTDDDYNTYKLLSGLYPEIVDNYYRMFVSRRYKCLLVPGQAIPTYDPFLTRFMVRAFDASNTKRSTLIKTFNVKEDPVMSLPTLWDALYDRDEDILNYITTQMVLVPSKSFTTDPILEGIYYSGMQEVIYPYNPVPDVDGFSPCILKDATRSALTPSADTKAKNHYQGTPLIPETHQKLWYVFTKNFYDCNKHMTIIEAQTWRYIRNEPVDQDKVLALANDYHNWGSLEKFYYVPILLLLIHSIIRGI